MPPPTPDLFYWGIGYEKSIPTVTTFSFGNDTGRTIIKTDSVINKLVVIPTPIISMTLTELFDLINAIILWIRQTVIQQYNIPFGLDETIEYKMILDSSNQKFICTFGRPIHSIEIEFSNLQHIDPNLIKVIIKNPAASVIITPSTIFSTIIELRSIINRKFKLFTTAPSSLQKS